MNVKIHALIEGKALIEVIATDAIEAACLLEKGKLSHAPPWDSDYTPFDFCMDMDALKETIILASDHYIEVARWSVAHDFMPMDEIAAIRHEEEQLSEHDKTSPFYLLALESRNPSPIADEANMVTIEVLTDNFYRFLIGMLYEWEATPENVDNLSHGVKSNISTLKDLKGHPFSCINSIFERIVPTDPPSYNLQKSSKP